MGTGGDRELAPARVQSWCTNGRMSWRTGASRAVGWSRLVARRRWAPSRASF